MGLIINKPGDLSLKHLFEKVELPLTRQDLLQSNVLQGGPVQTERGFVLHEPMLEASSDEKSNSIYASTLSVPGGLP